MALFFTGAALMGWMGSLAAQDAEIETNISDAAKVQIFMATPFHNEKTG
jgi:hypothetical protein